MQFTALVVFAIVWGGLMIFFLTPVNDKGESYTTVTWKVSLTRLILHKKAILAFALLLATLFSFWFYFESAEDYNQLHGITKESAEPQVIFYMVSVVIYTIIIYLFLAVRWAIKSVK
ncbi:hypothetical protein [Mesobacillus jeotgali]|uniref:hypothetical protein n=1 Tax=Mesobacillus jeotgali TaxID=129985 RepID=UPI0009A56B13|nr:hypothetical protein [Mesobacillus jeotgali]